MEQQPGGAMRQGALVHVFVFDSGPVPQDESKYVRGVVRSLLPETMAYADVPVTFFRDEKLLSTIGHAESSDVQRAIDYSFAWRMITQNSPELVGGLKAGKQKYTFSSEEYCGDAGNSGIVYAFYAMTKEVHT
ncbi:MAG: hypothetical protein FJ217_12345 [Ignavibacteria bacterium]|nr:hypothetical protein [Ignavibacteria bacterium]